MNVMMTIKNEQQYFRAVPDMLLLFTIVQYLRGTYVRLHY